MLKSSTDEMVQSEKNGVSSENRVAVVVSRNPVANMLFRQILPHTDSIRLRAVALTAILFTKVTGRY